ncbi:hypothetical protein NPIL_526091 [Nephila pilipes]|uniref:Uncharacterized protein n=1 Tax=Nephila pilipes TaxID=299642 RepID=A0A8X6Q215_NEPPI|nr:hypothetical protein NPIL_526091 [Nephila pilipes]
METGKESSGMVLPSFLPADYLFRWVGNTTLTPAGTKDLLTLAKAKGSEIWSYLEGTKTEYVYVDIRNGSLRHSAEKSSLAQTYKFYGDNDP